jgi:hypothetical protein
VVCAGVAAAGVVLWQVIDDPLLESRRRTSCRRAICQERKDMADEQAVRAALKNYLDVAGANFDATHEIYHEDGSWSSRSRANGSRAC